MMELGRRATAERIDVGKPLLCARDVYQAIGPTLRSERQEVFVVLGLDARNRIRVRHTAAVGGLTSCVVSPRDVFGPLVREACAAAICVHCHPSGDPTTSADDVELTRQLKKTGDLLGIRLLDHIVVGAEGFTSLADAGVL
jgi:DNA repair protein RadC